MEDRALLTNLVELGTNDLRISDIGTNGDATTGAAAPDVAFNAVRNEYLVVFDGDDSNGESDIYGQFITAAGAEIGTNDFQISNQGPANDTAFDAVDPKVAWNSADNEFLVVWRGDTATAGEDEIFGTILNADGSTAVSVFQISQVGTANNASQDAVDPEVVYNATDNEFLVVWSADHQQADELEIYGQRISAAGAEVGTNDFRISTQGAEGNTSVEAIEPAVAWNGQDNEYLVTWTAVTGGGSSIFGQLLTNTGGDSGSDFAISAQTNAEASDVVHNPVSNQYLVVYHAERVSGEFEIYGQRLTAAGAKRGTNDFRISSQNPNNVSIDANDPSVVFGSVDNEFLVAWHGDTSTAGEDEVFVQQLEADGSLIEGNQRISAVGPDNDINFTARFARPAFNSADDEYVVTFVADNNAGGQVDDENEIFVQRLGDLSLVVDTIVDESDGDFSTGDLSLREAIELANANGGADTITFDATLNGNDLMLTRGKITITEDVTITGNGQANTIIDAQQNSRIFDVRSNNGGDVVLEGMTFQNGSSQSVGGAIYLFTGFRLSINDSAFVNNSTTGVGGRGGAIYNGDSRLSINGSTFTGNYTVGNNAHGGAIGANSRVTVFDSTFTGNYTLGDGANGGAFGSTIGDVTLKRVTMSDNYAENGVGGAVFVEGRGLTILDSSFSENTAEAGGGVYYAGNDLQFQGSTLSGNTAELGAGGGLYIDSSQGPVSIINNTISGNTAAESGGGVYSTDSRNTKFTNSTITENIANGVEGGGGVYTVGNLVINNSIVAGNSDNSTAPDLYSQSSGYTVMNSLIGDAHGTSLVESQAADANGNFIGASTGGGIIDPMLGALADNGGPTFTHALVAGSLAINAGDDDLAVDTGNGNSQLQFDQRGTGFDRILDAAVDIGAFEGFVEVRSLIVTTENDVVDNSDNLTSLREAITFANEKPGADNITFDTAINGSDLLLTMGQMTITEDVTFTGNGTTNTIIDAQQNSRIFDITNSVVDVTLNGMTLQNGGMASQGGGAVRSQATGLLTIEDSLFQGNSTSSSQRHGGAISASHDVVITGSTFNENFVNGTANGGAIHVQGGTLDISDSTFTNNSTRDHNADGGAIFSSGALTVTRSTISDNFTTDRASRGGAIYGGRSITILDSTLSGNSTAGQDARGGAIFTSSALRITNSTLSGNSTAGDEAHGGATYSNELTITNSTLTGNSTIAANADGGAVHTSPGDGVTLRNSIVAGNTAGGTNPEILSGSGLSVEHSIIGDNSDTGLPESQTADAGGNFIGTSTNPIDPKIGDLQDNGGPTFTHALLADSVAIDAGDDLLAKDVDGNDLLTDQRGTGFARIFGGTVDIGAFEAGPTATATVNLSVDANSGTEADATVITVTATADAAVSGDQTVDVSVTGTGITASDYILSNTTITIPDGMTTGSVTFTVQDDGIPEPTETATLTISNPSAGVTLGATTTQDITITDNDSAPQAPTNVVASDTETVRPTISWDAEPNATSYGIWFIKLAEGAMPGSVVAGQSGLTSTSFTPDSDLANGNYSVWVRSINNVGTSTWSVPATFRIGPMLSVPQPPADVSVVDATVARPTIQWTPSADAESYGIWFINLAGGVVAGQSGLTGTSFTPSTDLVPGDEYRVYVRAMNSAGVSSWSTPVDFISGPTITVPAAPLNVTVVDTNTPRPTVQWDAAATATSYGIWFINLAGGVVAGQSGLTDLSFTPAVDVAEGEYSVYIRAFNAAGPSDWSIPATFRAGPMETIPPAPLNLTATDLETAQPTILWNNVPNAMTYGIWFVNLAGGIVAGQSGLTETSFETPETLNEGNYRVWVRSFNSAGVSDWSIPLDITITSPAIVKLESSDAQPDDDKQPLDLRLRLFDEEPTDVRMLTSVANTQNPQSRSQQETDNSEPARSTQASAKRLSPPTNLDLAFAQWANHKANDGMAHGKPHGTHSPEDDLMFPFLAIGQK